MKIPSLTTDQMREVDRLMVEVYGIELKQMMENAGRHLAELALRRYLLPDLAGKKVLVLAGSGGNGGGGLVAARHLQNRGVAVQVLTTRSPAKMTGVPGQQLSILQNMGIPVKDAGAVSDLPAADLTIDALIGYSLNGPPRGPTARLIEWANSQTCPILSLDIPSGLDATQGLLWATHVQADATMTLALPKIGLMTEAAQPSIGNLYLADISVPPGLYEQLGLQVGPLFSAQQILQIT